MGNVGHAAGPDSSGKPVAMAQIKAAAAAALASALGKETPNAPVEDTPVRKSPTSCGFHSQSHPTNEASHRVSLETSSRQFALLPSSTQPHALRRLTGCAGLRRPLARLPPRRRIRRPLPPAPPPPRRLHTSRAPCLTRTHRMRRSTPRRPPNRPLPTFSLTGAACRPSRSVWRCVLFLLLCPTTRAPTFQLPVEPSIECGRYSRPP